MHLLDVRGKALCLCSGFGQVNEHCDCFRYFTAVVHPTSRKHHCNSLDGERAQHIAAISKRDFIMRQQKKSCVYLLKECDAANIRQSDIPLHHKNDWTSMGSRRRRSLRANNLENHWTPNTTPTDCSVLLDGQRLYIEEVASSVFTRYCRCSQRRYD